MPPATGHGKEEDEEDLKQSGTDSITEIMAKNRTRRACKQSGTSPITEINNY
jgi:hypothetical protein